MAKVKVWNDKDTTHREIFKGDEISIPARSFVEMDYFDAYEFKGQYFPIEEDGAGVQTERSQKMIRIEEMGQNPDVSNIRPKCMKCGEEFLSQKQVDAHTKSEHAGEEFKDENLDREIEARNRAKKAKKPEEQAST